MLLRKMFNIKQEFIGDQPHYLPEDDRHDAAKHLRSLVEANRKIELKEKEKSQALSSSATGRAAPSLDLDLKSTFARIPTGHSTATEKAYIIKHKNPRTPRQPQAEGYRAQRSLDHKQQVRSGQEKYAFLAQSTLERSCRLIEEEDASSEASASQRRGPIATRRKVVFLPKLSVTSGSAYSQHDHLRHAGAVKSNSICWDIEEAPESQKHSGLAKTAVKPIPAKQTPTPLPQQPREPSLGRPEAPKPAKPKVFDCDTPLPDHREDPAAKSGFNELTFHKQATLPSVFTKAKR